MNKKALHAALSLSLALPLIASSTLFGATSSSDASFTREDRLIVAGGLAAGGAFLGYATADKYEVLGASLPKLSEHAQTALVVGGASLAVLAAGHGLAKMLTPAGEQQMLETQTAPLLHVVLDPIETQADARSSSYAASSSSSSSAASSSSCCDAEESLQRIEPQYAWGEITDECIKGLYVGMSQARLNQELRDLLQRNTDDWLHTRLAIAAVVHAGADVNLRYAAVLYVEADADLRYYYDNVEIFPLVKAIFESDFYLTKFLLEHGASRNIAVDDIRSLWYWGHDANIAKLLYVFGIRFNAQQCGATLLHDSIVERSVKKLNLMIGFGADINGCWIHSPGCTPLRRIAFDIACSRDFSTDTMQMIALLLRAGANNITKTEEGIRIIDRFAGKSKKHGALANLFMAFKNPKTSLLEHLIIDAVLDTYSLEEDVQRQGVTNIKMIRAIKPECSDAVDRFYTEKQ